MSTSPVATGVVTLLFTDLVGSSAMLDSLGESAGEDLRRVHFRLLRQSVAEAGGEEVKNLGDGLMVAFASAVRALECAIAMQRAIDRHNRMADRDVDRLAVRVGLHVGEAIREDDDYFGTPVVIAKRLCDSAAGGQILASELVRGLVGSHGDFRFVAVGPTKLRGLSEPIEAHELRWDDDDRGAGRRDAIDPRGIPLVGRAEDLRVLEDEFTRAAGGEARVALVLGEPGVGKTRVSTELTGRHRNEAVALVARAYPLGATASLAPWTEAIERHLRPLEADAVRSLAEPYLDDLASLLPSVADARVGAPDRPPEPARVLAGLTSLLGNLSRTAPVMLVLDDVHLADGSSWEALSYVAHNLAERRVLVVLTARPVELSEYVMATEIVYGLEQDGLLRRVELQPLDRAEMTRLAGAFVDPARVSDALVDWLVERSRGVSLFAVGLMRALLDEDADLDHPRLEELPEDLAQRVTALLERFDPRGRALLELLAVLGYRVELGDVVALGGRSLDETADLLDALVRKRFVAEDEHGRELTYEIAHPLIEQAIYQRIGRARRRALHRHVARVLVESGQFGAAAGHFVRSADLGDAEAVIALCEALRQAEAREHHHEALALVDALLDLLPAGDRRWLDVFDAMRWQSDWVVDHRADWSSDIGIRAMRNIEQLAEASPDLTRRGAVRFHLGTLLAWSGGETETGIALVGEAEQLFREAGESSRALIARNELGYLDAISGDPDGHEAAASEVLAEAERLGDRFAEMQALGSLIWAVQWTGRIETSLPIMDRARARARADGKWYRTSYVLGQQALALALLGRQSEADVCFAAGKAANPSFRDTLLPDFEILVRWLRGDVTHAADAGRDLLAWSRGLSSPRRLGFSFAATSAAEAGRTDDAVTWLDTSAAAYEGGFYIFSDLVTWAGGVLHALRGETDAARDTLREGMQPAISRRSGLSGRFAAFDLAELAAETGDTEVAELAEAAVRAFGPTDAEALQAIDTVVAVASATARSEPDAAEELARAEAVFAAAGWRLFEARTAALRARALARTDRSASVVTLGDAVKRFAEIGATVREQKAAKSLGGLGPAGRRARSVGTGLGALTKREREVAILAADGLTAREIGQRLFIGERTVETHLANSYAKLGVRSRLELARQLPDLGP